MMLINGFECRKITFKAVAYSESLKKYFISDALAVDSGLSCLFGFENEGLDKFDDVVLTSKKFINEIKEDWWERDWCHIANIQGTLHNDIKDVEIFEGDIVKWGHLDGYGSEAFIRVAVVELFPSLQFKILYYIDKKTGLKKETDNYVFQFGRFAYQETHKYLEIIGNVFESEENNQ